MFQQAQMLTIFDVRCVHRPNPTFYPKSAIPLFLQLQPQNFLHPFLARKLPAQSTKYHCCFVTVLFPMAVPQICVADIARQQRRPEQGLDVNFVTNN